MTSRLRGMDEAAEDQPGAEPADAAELGRAVTELTREVRGLADRVDRLGAIAESLAPGGSTGRTAPRKPSADGASSHGDTAPANSFLVVVSPVSELAMAAVAETSLRELPAVRRVLAITRSEDKIRFEIELEPDAELVDPLRAAMPVSFDVESSDERELVISLQPAWGPAPPP